MANDLRCIEELSWTLFAHPSPVMEDNLGNLPQSRLATDRRSVCRRSILLLGLVVQLVRFAWATMF